MVYKYTWSVLVFSLLGTLAHTQNYLMTSSLDAVTDCSGFFLDSGGGSGDYGPGENFVTTICPDGSTGTHIKLNFSGVEIGPGDQLCFYDDATVNPARLLACAYEFDAGAPFIIQASAVNQTGCVTISFTSDNAAQGAGWSAAISCEAACQQIEASLTTSVPQVEPADTGWIDICPGERLFLSAAGNYPQNNTAYTQSDLTSSFEWDFGDGIRGYGPDASHVYYQPGGYIVQLVITDTLKCTNSNFINQRVRVADKPTFNIGGNIENEICAGDTIRLSASIGSIDPEKNISVRPVTTSFENGGIRTDSLALPDGTGAAYNSTIDITGFGPGQLLDNIDDLQSICVNIEHSWMRDMEISITCPNGNSVVLHDHPGNVGGMVLLGEPVDFDGTNPIPGLGYDYCWTPTATRGTWLEYANDNFGLFGTGTLPAGDYNSFQPLSNLAGCPLNGEWMITVQDWWAQDNGYIFSWSINFDPALYPALETFTPELTNSTWEDNPTILLNQSDSLIASPTNAGSAVYTYTVEDSFGCMWDTTLNFSILPPTHPDCHECGKILNVGLDTTLCNGDDLIVDMTPSNSLIQPVTFETFPNELIGFDNYPPPIPYLAPININNLNPALLTTPSAQIQSVCIDISTDFVWDLQVFLQAPDGKQMELTTNNGGAGSYTRTCFTPDAVNPIQSGTAPFTGNYIPEGDWSDLAGSPVNGDWNLMVGDAAGPNQFGTLNNWSVTFLNENEITYTWSNPAIVSCSNCPAPTITPTQSETLIVNARDIYNCSDTDSLAIEVFSQPGPIANCAGSQDGFLSINWPQTPDVGFYEVNVNNSGWNQISDIVFTSGFYNPGEWVDFQIRAFHDIGCYSDISTLRCQYIACEIESSATLTPPTCSDSADAQIQVSATNGFAPYQFSINGNPFQTDSIFRNLSAGNYFIQIMDGLNCRDTIHVEIVNPEPLSVMAVQHTAVRCYGFSDGIAEAIVEGGTAPFSFTWNDPLNQTGQTASDLPAGIYEVTLEDAGGCTATDTVQISEPPVIQIDFANTDILCRGDSTGRIRADVSGGIPPYNYSWNDRNNQMGAMAENLLAGTFTVTVTDANGCEAARFTTLTQPATSPMAEAVQTHQSCDGISKNEATVNVSGGTGSSFSYLWSNGQNTATVGNLSPQIYTVTVTDENNCPAVDTILIEELDPILISFGINIPNCFGESSGGLAVTDVTGGSGIFSNNGFIWSTGETGRIIQNLEGGRNYTVSVTDNQGCMSDTTIFLEQPDPVRLIVDSTSVSCFGGRDGAAFVTNVITPNGIRSYTWDANAGSRTTSSVDSLSAGLYFVTVEDDLGCEAVEDILVTQPAPLDFYSDITDNQCFGDRDGRITLSLSGGTPFLNNIKYQITWSNGQVGTTIQNLSSGSYGFTATDANGCLLSDSLRVANPPPIDAIVTTDSVACFGEKNGEIVIETQGGIPPYRYSLDGENFNGSNNQIGLSAGEYDVYIRDANGCLWIDKATVGEPMPFSIDAGPPFVEIQLGDSVTLKANSQNGRPPVYFEWNAPFEGTLSCNICDSTIASPMTSVFYNLYGQDVNGCEDTDRIEVRVLKDRNVAVPTGFTPNGDGENDRLIVHGKSGTMVKRFQVYDRWGELVYESRDFEVNQESAGWDGYFRGKPMNAGVYQWYLEIEYLDGAEETIYGHSTLIR